MSDYQVTNYGMCGECKWHRKDDDGSIEEWVCHNTESDYFPYATDYTDTCDMWEQKGIE